jgi:urate oxidase
MAVLLTHNSYGKSRVRLTKVERHAERHDLFEWSLDIQLEGDFVPAYTDGNNLNVIATDTMKNTVYALAADALLGSPEAFGLLLAKHFLGYPQVSRASVAIRADHWARIHVGDAPHAHAFVGSGAEQRTCVVRATPEGNAVVSGLDHLVVMKTSDSAWKDFHRDEYRTLPDTDDRILATSLAATWSYHSPVEWNHAHHDVRLALLKAFAGHKSLGAQHTLFAMGEAALAAVPALEEITIAMPNRHRIPVDLVPLGRKNTNSVFVATDEPHGLIQGTIRRG